ncbi:MAG: LSU rRNA pseudouridine(1911/1915/1917) synthase [Burkholderiaceae bacterium]|jgi:23S rRNA pseudouridine1911/1915/1917 synthase|nr:MAG: LSU rRNA pseudouridine(1911/1915/1917) synthase [Burkholderiaceae bacterium]
MISREGRPIISSPPVANALPQAPDDGAEPGVEVEWRAFAADRAQHGERLDRVLAALLPEFSRSYLQQLIEAGAVQLNGAAWRKSATRLKAGDSGRIELRPTAQALAFRPQPLVLDVLHEDEHLLVLNKPAGLVVHPAPGHWSGTLLNGLLARDDHAARLPRAGIVHRLDKDTSGLMVVARSRIAMEALVRQIAARAVARQYLALAHRAWRGPPERRIDAAIGRDPRNRLRMAVVDLSENHGKPANTLIKLLQNCEQGCFLRCTLGTGRTHQIRVHLASLGHPLVADTLYGGAAAAGLERQALHAFRLAFRHPVSGEAMTFHAPLPADMNQALERWQLRYNGGTEP